jgi:energy-coupling factor transporter transmembrane protein EcfT
MARKNIIGKFKDEDKLLSALTKLKDNKVNLVDIYGPFANHALLKQLTRESRLPYMAIIYGIIGALSMFALIYYTAVIDYPINYGGKPYFSFPPMVVLMFLFTILVTTILLVFTFHGRSMVFPGKPAKIINTDVTDDTFYLVVGQNYNPEEIKVWLQETGADEIFEKELD